MLVSYMDFLIWTLYHLFGISIEFIDFLKNTFCPFFFQKFHIKRWSHAFFLFQHFHIKRWSFTPNFTQPLARGRTYTCIMRGRSQIGSQTYRARFTCARTVRRTTRVRINMRKKMKEMRVGGGRGLERGGNPLPQQLLSYIFVWCSRTYMYTCIMRTYIHTYTHMWWGGGGWGINHGNTMGVGRVGLSLPV